MSKAIGIPVEYPTPLPWLPPTCKSYDGKTKYDKLPTIEKWTHISVRKAEREIEAEYYKYSSEKNFHEWGARYINSFTIQSKPRFWRIHPTTYLLSWVRYPKETIFQGSWSHGSKY